MQLLREVVLEADLADRLELRLQPVDVLLLADEDVGEQLAGAVVALRDGQFDAAIEAIDRFDLEGGSASNCSGTVSPMRSGK